MKDDRLKMKVCLCLAIVLSLYACKNNLINSQKSASLNCNRSLVFFLKNNWQYIPNGDYYEISDTLENSLKTTFYDCLIGKDTAWVKSVFGKYRTSTAMAPYIKPGDKAIGSVRYQIGAKTSTAGSVRYKFYNFFYDGNGKIVRHSFGGHSIDASIMNNRTN